MSKRLIPILFLLAVVVLLAMVNFTTPADVGPLGVLVFFGAVYLVLYGVMHVLVVVFTKMCGGKMGKKQYLYSAILAFGPIMLLLAQSLGTMNLWSVGLMVIFVILGCFLVSKRVN